MNPGRKEESVRQSPARRSSGLVWLAPAVALALAVATIALAVTPSPQEPAAFANPTLTGAKVFLAKGDWERAEATLRSVGGPEAKFLLGKHLAGRGKKWTEARSLLMEATSDSERRSEALRLLAQGSMDHSDWAGALGFLRDLEKAEPKDSKVLKALALCLQKSGDPLGALAAAQRGLALAPGDRELLTLMSEAAEASAMSAVRPRAPDGLPQPLRYGRRSR